MRRPSGVGSAIATMRASISSRRRSTTSCSSRGELELADERGADLLQRLELPRPARRRFVEARVLDRDGGLRREERDQLLVLLVEVGSALLLGQIEVAVGDAAQHDRRPEERPHRRMAGREADGARVLGQIVQAQRAGVGDQRAEDAASAGQVADDRPCLVVDAVRDEALEARSRRVDDAERRVPGAGDERRRLDDALQDAVERQLRADREAGLQEGAQPR